MKTKLKTDFPAVLDLPDSIDLSDSDSDSDGEEGEISSECWSDVLTKYRVE